jgi:Ca2+-transporting ATPase
MTEPLGLTSAEASRRRQSFGLNRSEVKDRDSLWEEFAESIREPLQLLLIVVGILYAVFGELRDAVIIFGVIITVAGVETWTEWRSGQAIAALAKLAAPQAQVWRDGVLQQLAPEELVPGDVIGLAAGSRVPADARLIEADELAVDESLVTGESQPVEHDIKPGGNPSLLAGSLVVGGRATAEVSATGAQSTLGRIASLVAGEESPRTPLQRQMGELARALVVVALAVSVLVPAIGIMTGQPLREMILTGLTLAFATIPEELPILIVIVLGLGSLQLAREGAIVRRLIAAETLGATTVVCTDKTGTLTQNRMTLAGSYPAASLLAGTAAGNDVGFLLRSARLASERPSASVAGFVDPVDTAIWQADGSAPALSLERRFPFDTTRRMASAVERANGRVVLGAKGAPEAIVQRSTTWRSTDGPKPLLESLKETILDAARRQAAAGGRVLAVASRELPSKTIDRDAAEHDLVFEGLIVLSDPVRPEVPEAVREVRSAGVAVSVVTGDQAGTAAAVAKTAGLDLPVFSPADVAGFDDAALAVRAKAGAIFARTQPADKLRIVRSLAAAGEVVAVTGDGVNDAPALRAATIGVAMRRGGTDVAREAADLVITDDNFATLVRAMAEGRRLYDNLRKAVRYYLAVKVALITLSLGAALAHLPLPFAPLQIVILELFMDLGASLAFVSQRAEDDVMRRPPRRPDRPFLDRSMVAGILAGGLTLAAITGAAFVVGLSRYPVASARTLALVAWLVGHAVLGIVMAWERRPVSLRDLLANKALIGWAAAAMIFASVITLIGPVREALHAGAVPISAAGLAGLAAVIGPLWLEFVKRLRSSGQGG